MMSFNSQQTNNRHSIADSQPLYSEAKKDLVVVVDDQVLAQLYVQSLVSRVCPELEIITIGSQEEAIKVIEENLYRIKGLIIDVVFKEKQNGFQFAESILEKFKKEGSLLQIIMMSSSFNKENFITANKIGAPFVVKSSMSAYEDLFLAVLEQYLK